LFANDTSETAEETKQDVENADETNKDAETDISILESFQLDEDLSVGLAWLEPTKKSLNVSDPNLRETLTTFFEDKVSKMDRDHIKKLCKSKRGNTQEIKLNAKLEILISWLTGIQPVAFQPSPHTTFLCFVISLPVFGEKNKVQRA
jgi:hypothetical protein